MSKFYLKDENDNPVRLITENEKVTEINSSSTDNECPTAKASYNILSHLPYITTAPTADNQNGLAIVVLDGEPEQKYNGYIYFIK